MKFILDNMISPKFARALSCLDKDVIALREIYSQDSPDVEWLPRIAADEKVLITVDKHIRSRPQERFVLHNERVTAFFLGPFFSKRKFWDQAVWLVKHWPQIEQMAANIVRGTCSSVQKNGKMTALSDRG